jgi:hypothetical protein
VNACIFTQPADTFGAILLPGLWETAFPLDKEPVAGLFNLFIRAKKIYSKQNPTELPTE